MYVRKKKIVAEDDSCRLEIEIRLMPKNKWFEEDIRNLLNKLKNRSFGMLAPDFFEYEEVKIK